MRHIIGRTVTLFAWALGVWFVLTWSLDAEQVVSGLAVAALTSVAMASLGPVARPWLLLEPRVLAAVLRMVGAAAVRIVRANLSLARRIWSPRRPLRSGMVIVPTTMDTDGGLAGVGLITSLVVDNQVVDLDRSTKRLHYHAVAVPDGTLEERVRAINGPFEALLRPIVDRS